MKIHGPVILKWLASVIGTISALVGAVTTLAFALGKIPEAYDAVCNNFLPCPDRFAWLDSEPVTLSHYIRSETLFVMPSLKQVASTDPKRRYLKPPQATCAAADSNAWKLADGTQILDNDPLLTQGWTSPSWVGRPEPPDWEKFDRIAKTRFGWTPGFANNNRCPADSRCRISPEEIKQHSKQILVANNAGCKTMEMGNDLNYSPDYTSLTVTIRGHSDADTLWSVVVPTQTYTAITPWSATAAEVRGVHK
jgi:hypothetical protein